MLKKCLGNRPIMTVMTRTKTGTSRDRQGQNRNSIDKTGTAGTKQGQSGTNTGTCRAKKNRDIRYKT